MSCLLLFASLTTVFSLASGIAAKADKVIPLDGNLVVISSDGSLNDSAVFNRYSAAQTPDGNIFSAHQPRFWNGGVLIETEKRAKRQVNDRLSYAIIEPSFGHKGAIACNVELVSKSSPQTLLTIGTGDWKNPFEVTLSRNKNGAANLAVQFHGKRAAAKTSWTEGERRHLIVSWDNKNVTLYINGKKEAVCASADQSFKDDHVLYIGSRKIRLGSNAIFSNVVLFKEPLTDSEAETLASAPDLRSQIKMKKIMKTSRFSAFPVNTGVVTIRFSSAAPCKSVSTKIDSYDIVRTEIEDGNQIICRFDPSLLMPGKYQLKLDGTLTDGTQESLLVPIEICKALRPKENLQVNTWGESAKTHPDFGVTMVATHTNAAAIDEAARMGVYGTFNYHYFGTPRKDHPEDSAYGVKGKAIFANPRSPYIQQDVLKATREVMKRVKDSPVFLGIVVNSEIPTGGSGYDCFDFSPEEIERAKGFGLDLTKWKTGKRTIFPMGNLRASVAPELCPQDGVIPEDNPLYAYHLDRHSGNGGTEVVTNDLIAKEILRERPDIFAIQDPIMRRPILRSYKNVNIAADWVYYSNLVVVVSATERLLAVARGNPGMTVCCMPQFLFKRNTVAPFAGLPTADMFREACLLAVSRPTRIVTFWNAKAALCPPEKDPRNIRYAWDAGQTPEELAKMFDGKSREEIMKIIDQKKGKVFCLPPGVKETFKELSDTIWQPFGALFPQWKNAPRKMAVVRSFASDLFSNVEWPGIRMPMLAETFSLGVPCDVLLDEDLSKDLSQYDLIVLPQISALPKKGVENLLAFREKGGVIVADNQLKVKPLIEAAIQLEKTEGGNQDFAQKAEELLKQCNGDKNSIGYIEGIQILQEQAAAASGFPELRPLIRKHVKTDFRTANNAVFWNHLQAAGADYLFAVNDSRVPGPIYGKYGKIKENGVPQKVSFDICNPAFRYAYDLTQQKQLEIANGKLQLELGPCNGRIILFTGKELGTLQIRCPDTVQGGKAELSVTIEQGSGLIPVQLELYDPSSRKLSLSCSDVVKNGSLRRAWTIPLNAPSGTWKIRVRELAKGQQAETAFQVGKR